MAALSNMMPIVKHAWESSPVQNPIPTNINPAQGRAAIQITSWFMNGAKKGRYTMAVARYTIITPPRPKDFNAHVLWVPARTTLPIIRGMRCPTSIRMYLPLCRAG
eukprot:TRINITY_DN35555_c0_g1_i1.p2 TRINITY_DN35555_c0_g1~~TRINITY_DN35555_c0_g1_i1.p2  ORF type:complete len:106 (-),score=15.25 TRINITY_DN35555_c0_g1_i1:7-324(-)